MPPPESRPTAWLTTTAVIGRLPFAISHHKFFGGCTSGEAHACPPRGPSGCVGAGARCTWQSGGPGLAGRLWTALRAAAVPGHICSTFRGLLAEDPSAVRRKQAKLFVDVRRMPPPASVALHFCCPSACVVGPRRGPRNPSRCARARSGTYRLSGDLGCSRGEPKPSCPSRLFRRRSGSASPCFTSNVSSVTSIRPYVVDKVTCSHVAST